MLERFLLGSPYEKEKEAAYRLPVGSLWVAYCFTYNLLAAPVGKSCLFVALLAAYGQNKQPVGSSKLVQYAE